jgi:hypothetical protein
MQAAFSGEVAQGYPIEARSHSLSRPVACSICSDARSLYFDHEPGKGIGGLGLCRLTVEELLYDLFMLLP